MHSGEAYHEFMLGSTRDRRVRARFQREALSILRAGAAIFDFGAGTGLDAKFFASNGYRVFVHEPSEAMHSYLICYCRNEIDEGRIVQSDLSTVPAVNLVVANFAVLNLIPNRSDVYKRLSCVVVEHGYLLASFLNPYFLGDVRYSWWRKNLRNLATSGIYSVAGETGPIFRFTPSVAAREAAPAFRVAKVIPGRGGLAFHQYVFMLLQRV